MDIQLQVVPYSKQIPLTRGKLATVNYHWYYFLMQWKWHYSDTKGRGYAVHGFRVKNKRLTFRMHRFILGLFHGDEREGDHINGDPLNNIIGDCLYKGNLRIANDMQTAQNTSARKNSTSKYLGVSLKIIGRRNNKKKTWCAQITIFKAKKHIGLFPYTAEGEIAAAKAYDLKAKENYGEFANLNFPE